MKKIFSILEDLEANGSTVVKAKIIEEGMKEDPRLFDILEAAMNAKRRFFIKHWNPVSVMPDNEAIDLHDDFMVLLNALETNGSRSDKIRESVENFMSHCTLMQQKWYTRVIKKNLRIGVGHKLTAKAGLNIPEFEVQLAKDGKQNKKLEQIIQKGVFLSPKLDGYRCIALVEDGAVTLLTREGNIFDNFPTIEAAVLEFAKANHKDYMVLDGEIMSDDFNAMQQSAFASTRGTTVGDVKYHVFDEIKYSEWVSDDFTETAGLRYTLLRNHFLNYKGTQLVQVVHIPCNTLKDALDFEKSCIQVGYEGGMINPDIPYYRGKLSNKMMKLKTFESMDCVVTGIYEGEDKRAGMMGGVTVTQENGFSCDVGSGFKEKDLIEMWKNPALIVGRLIEVKYQELSKDGIMRFPVFKRFRDGGNGQGKR